MIEMWYHEPLATKEPKEWTKTFLFEGQSPSIAFSNIKETFTKEKRNKGMEDVYQSIEKISERPAL